MTGWVASRACNVVTWWSLAFYGLEAWYENTGIFCNNACKIAHVRGRVLGKEACRAHTRQVVPRHSGALSKG
jgi:hypothetical protein